MTNRFKIFAAQGFVAMALGACAQSRQEPIATIDTGIYGRMDRVSEYGDVRLLTNVDLQAYPITPFNAPPEDGQTSISGKTAITTRSDSRGIFQLALSPGDWMACANTRCAVVSVQEQKATRIDYSSGWASGDFWVNGEEKNLATYRFGDCESEATKYSLCRDADNYCFSRGGPCMGGDVACTETILKDWSHTEGIRAYCGSVGIYCANPGGSTIATNPIPLIGCAP